MLIIPANSATIPVPVASKTGLLDAFLVKPAKTCFWISTASAFQLVLKDIIKNCSLENARNAALIARVLVQSLGLSIYARIATQMAYSPI